MTKHRQNIVNRNNALVTIGKSLLAIFENYDLPKCLNALVKD